MDKKLTAVRITQNKEISPNVFLISWANSLDFEAGQVVKISADLNTPPRIYSICSGNKEKEISVLYNVKPSGKLTPVLSHLQSGDEIFVSRPYGSFSCEDVPSYWIATGTGIAPFYSMIRSGLTSNKILVHGVSFDNQFYFEEMLKQDLGSNYIRCCSRGKAPESFHGRVTDFLTSQTDLPKDHKYYLCGQSSMVVEVRDLLIAAGIPYNQIHAEIYF